MQIELNFDAEFDGETYDSSRDKPRLKKQIHRVYDAMLDSRWRTLTEIADIANAPEASVSARLRDLRKEKFGGHEVERRNIQGGLWEYRLLKND